MYLKCACFPVLVLSTWDKKHLWLNTLPVLSSLTHTKGCTCVCRCVCVLVCVSLGLTVACHLCTTRSQKSREVVRPAARWRKQQQDLCSVNLNRFCALRVQEMVPSESPWLTAPIINLPLSYWNVSLLFLKLCYGWILIFFWWKLIYKTDSKYLNIMHSF